MLVPKKIFLAIQLYSLFSHGKSFVLWNVGQGMWGSIVSKTECIHIDMGGEYFPSQNTLLKHCAGKINSVSISHWDQDHYSLIQRASRLFRFCLVPPYPQEIPPKVKKLKLKDCKATSLVRFQLAPHGNLKNDRSFVIQESNFIYPSDIPQNIEKLWQLPQTKIRFLIASHHGSRNSNSIDFLSQFRGPIMVLISARKAKFGHPHLEAINRIKMIHFAPLSTENWGNLHIEIP